MKSHDNNGNIHIFDIDNTVINTITVKDFLLAGIKEGILPLGIFLYLPYLFIHLTFSSLDDRVLKKKFHLLKGISENDLTRLSEVLFETKFRYMLNKNIIDLIDNIRVKGEKILIASASFNFILTPFSHEFEAKDIIATEIEFFEGYSTGRLKERPAYGAGKWKRIVNYFEKNGIDAEDCVGYSDSYSDLHFLELVGHPIAVNPDRRLRRIACKRGWDIIETQVKGVSKYA